MNLRPEKGDDADPRRGSVYPDELCYLLAWAANCHLAAVRQIPLDPAYTLDGHDESCAVCFNLTAGSSKRDLYGCDGCTSVFHYRCIPRGCPKPRRNGFPWFCPEDACQQKRAAVADGAS